MQSPHDCRPSAARASAPCHARREPDSTGSGGASTRKALSTWEPKYWGALMATRLRPGHVWRSADLCRLLVGAQPSAGVQAPQALWGAL